MGGLVENAIEHVLQSVLGAALTWLGHVSVWIGDLGVLQTQLPWVQTAQHTLMAVAATLLGVYIAYIALTRWILWNDGTADFDGTVLFKSILRATLYFGISGSLVVLVYRFGLDLGWTIMGTSLTAGTHTLHGISGDIFSRVAKVSGAGGGMVLLSVIVLALAVVLLAVIFAETLERAAELVIYYLAAPFVALGQLNPDGGTWGGWWRYLVVLSLSQAVQLLCLKGMAGTTQLIPALGYHNASGGSIGTMLALCLDLGWLLVGVRGPHLLREWSYRSGFATAVGWVGNNVGSNAMRGGSGGSSAPAAKP